MVKSRYLSEFTGRLNLPLRRAPRTKFKDIPKKVEYLENITSEWDPKKVGGFAYDVHTRGTPDKWTPEQRLVMSDIAENLAERTDTSPEDWVTLNDGGLGGDIVGRSAFGTGAAAGQGFKMVIHDTPGEPGGLLYMERMDQTELKKGLRQEAEVGGFYKLVQSAPQESSLDQSTNVKLSATRKIAGRLAGFFGGLAGVLAGRAAH